ncbi:MAG TPA: hypothetical protein VHW64_01490 [Nocardioides sp.]|jgi:hypothetical protein|uniref:hypothetical protein n=1 Tax=Nocardioides sp. TaxID=35761 RepID=UPI002E31C0B2|nr:hypothetical protein [Nocardioides sp.]HEX3929346.1 hypothetical protein [Nocardioides sp.]
MQGESDTTTGRAGRAAPSRRALARAGVHAAWAVPAVALATAAPAEAATSAPAAPQLVMTEATYWVKTWYFATAVYGVVPHFTVTNPASTATSFWVTMRFRTSDFTGLDHSHQPPRPMIYNSGLLQPSGWELEVLPGGASDDFVDLQYVHDARLGQNESVVLAIPTSNNPGAIAWANNPTATTTIPCTITPFSAALSASVGSLTQIAKPPSGP